MMDSINDESILKIVMENGSIYRLYGNMAENIISGSEKLNISISEYVRKYTRFRQAEYVEILKRKSKGSVEKHSDQKSIEIFFNSHLCLDIRHHIRISGPEASRIIEEASKRNMSVEKYLMSRDSPYMGVEKVIVT